MDFRISQTQEQSGSRPVTAASYKMSFSTGGLFVNESVAVARLHKTGSIWTETIDKAMEDGATSLPKAASNRRTLREIVNRVSCLTDDERQFLVEDADRSEQVALLWLAACRAYRFVREFAVEILRERFLSYRLDLPLAAFDQFFDSKAEWNDGLASISLSTRKKLRQVLFRMLREAGIVDDRETIQSAYLSARLVSLVRRRDPNDLLFFPGLQL